MPNRDYRTNQDYSADKSVNGYLITTSGPASAPQVTAVTGTDAERFGATVDLGADSVARTGVIAQYVNPTTAVPSGISFEIQWSLDGTNFFPAPSSAQGDERLSTITTSGQDKSIVSRGQVLTRYLRWRLFSAANIPAGTMYMWYGRL